MEALQSKEQFSMILKEERVIVMFSAPWCGDCVALEPHLPEVEALFPTFTFYYADRDLFIDECIQHDIMGIPSFLAFHKGQEIARFVSRFSKTKEEVINFMNEAKGAIA